MSCLCFAKLSIQFRFDEFRANSICSMFREGHAEFLYEFDPCMHIYVVIILLHPQVIMKVNGRMVERYWQSTVDDMYEKD